jgi:hypothetical protein
MFTVVGNKSGTVAIDVHFLFEHAACHCETYFRFHSPQQNEQAISLTKSDENQT